MSFKVRERRPDARDPALGFARPTLYVLGSTTTSIPGPAADARRFIPIHTEIPVGKFSYARWKEIKLVINLLFQHFVMFNYVGSARGSVPPPYSGSSPSFPSAVRTQHHRSPGYGHGTPPNTPYNRQYGFESAALPYSEGTRRRRGIIPPHGMGGPNDLKRPSRVFTDDRPSVSSTLFEPPEKDPSYSPPLYEDRRGIDRFKDEDEINFNILR